MNLQTRSNMDFRNVPFSYVPMNVRQKLAQSLDIKCNIFASDWTSLGAELGLTFVEKMLLERNMYSCESITMVFLKEWSKNNQNTVGKILDALQKINRPHEVQKLNEAKNEILECYFSSEDESVFQPCNRISYSSSNLSVDTQSETSSLNDIYCLNSYERAPFASNVISEERNSRQLSYSIPETSSIADSRLGRLTEHVMNPSLISSSTNDALVVNKNYNHSHSSHSFIPEKIVNCGGHKDKKHIRVFITYGNGDKSHGSRIVHLSQFIEKYFFCNVDLKNNRLKQNKVDEYFKKAHFVLMCFDQEYMESIHKVESDEEKPNEPHTSYIFSKIKIEASEKSSHRFVPLLLKGGSKDNVPCWLNNRSFKFPDQYNELLLFLRNPQNTINFSDSTSL